MTTNAAELPSDPLEPTRVTKNSWLTLTAAILGWCLDAMDWMLLALALPLIGKDLGLTLPELGMLGTATLGGAAASGLFVGVLAVKFGRVRLLMVTMLWYAVFTGFCGLANDFWQLLLLRFLTGLGLGGEWGVGAALISDTWPRKYRAWASSAVYNGWPLGYGLASVAFMTVTPLWGWRGLFFLGVLPAIVAIVVRLTVPEPEAWTKSKQAPKAAKPTAPLRSLFQGPYLRRTILATVMSSGALMTSWACNTWIPSFLYTVKHLDVVRTGSFLIILNLGGMAGHQTFGYLSGKLGRKPSMLLGMALTVVCTLIYINIDSPDAIFWFSPIFGFTTYGYFGTFGSYLSELYPVETRATGVSFTFNMGRGLSMVSPIIVGILAASYGLVFGIGVTVMFTVVAMVALILLPETHNPREAQEVERAAATQ